MKNEQYIIKGMTCSACSATVQNNVSKKTGVNKCNVNLLNEKMDIEYDEKVISKNEIFDLVKSLGYKPYDLDAKFDKKNDNAKQLKFNFFLSLIFLIPLMILSMGHMIGLPLPEVLSATRFAPISALTQLLITLAIVIINRNFFTKAGFF